MIEGVIMEKAKLNIDRRKHPRARVTVSVQYKLLNNSSEVEEILSENRNWHPAESENLSGSGVSLVTKINLKKHDVIKLDLEIPEPPRKLKAFAEVVWCKSSETQKGFYQAGINFLAVKQDEEDLLGRFVMNIILRGGEV